MSEADDQLSLEVSRAAWWIRYYTRQKGISLDALAVYAKVGRSSVTQMRNRAPSLRTLSTIAVYLGVQVKDLLQAIPSDKRDEGLEATDE